jgi:hypothetical protein
LHHGQLTRPAMRSLACGFTHEPDRTEQAVVVHRGGLHLRFDPAPTRDDVGYLARFLMIAAAMACCSVFV